MTRTRVRKYPSGGQKIGRSLYFNSDVFLPIATIVQSCTDEIHRGPPYRTGGPLGISKNMVSRPLSESIRMYQTWTPKDGYDGQFYAHHYIPPVLPSPTDLSTWSTRAWYRAMPIRDVGGVARFIGELKDAPRMLQGTFEFFKQFDSDTWRNLSPAFWSNAYLNFQFGWSAFIRDLFGLIDLGTKVDAALKQLIARNGKPIRRNFTMDNKTVYSQVENQSGVISIDPLLTTPCYENINDKFNTRTTGYRFQRRIWFSSKWHYYFTPEELASPAFRSYLKAQLSGTIPDMNAVWQLIPWTWLIDWFTNAGTIVKNLVMTNKYRQVAEYAYIMCEESHLYRTQAFTRVRKGESTQLFLLPAVTVRCESSNEYEFKRRVAASPYGFGLTWEGFNPFQISILVALGLSRAKV